ncbi:MAG: UDP-3-O-(3-hydroxymyristoyl)glucosamine N-acyltransferase [Gammaproteobacteria bacterium]
MEGFSLGELAVRHGLQLRGNPDHRVTRVGTLESAGPEAVSFLANPRYRRQLTETAAGAVVVAQAAADDCPVAALVSDNPYASYARIAADLYPQPAFEPGVSPAASVDPSAVLGEGSRVEAGAVIGAGARIGAGSLVGPGCVVGPGVVTGTGCRLVANVTLCHDVILGDRVLVHPGVVVGADGFGLAREPEGWIKVPQVGSVRIGSDVEIGANTTIDRGAIEDTVIGDGVKLDNQIQVAHNVRIGEHTVVAGCVGISGSTVIGARCMIGGAVGIAGHLEIADDTVVTGMTLVSHSIRQPGVYSGALPVDEARRWRRNSARFRQLDSIAARLKGLERRLDVAAGGDAGSGDASRSTEEDNG